VPVWTAGRIYTKLMSVIEDLPEFEKQLAALFHLLLYAEDSRCCTWYMSSV